MCGERLRLYRGRHGRAVEVGLLALAALACYASGARGLWLIIAPCIVYWPLTVTAGIIQGLFFPKLAIDKPKYGDTDFHITG
jgi:hypothetical protein